MFSPPPEPNDETLHHYVIYYWGCPDHIFSLDLIPIFFNNEELPILIFLFFLPLNK